MKYVKLVSIFMVLLLAVGGVLYFSNSGSGSSSGSGSGSSSDFSYCKSVIDAAWRKVKKWDKQTYEQNIADIRSVKSRSDEMDDTDVQKLLDYNDALAFNYVERQIFAEWKKKDCKEKEVRNLYSASSTIEKNKSFSKNVDAFRQIKGCYNYYMKVLKLRCAEITSVYFPDSLEWRWEWEYENQPRTSHKYEDYERDMNAQITECVPEQYLKDIKNAIQKPIENYRAQLTQMESKAYRQLASQILEAYPSLENADIDGDMEYYRTRKKNLQKIYFKLPDQYQALLDERKELYEDMIK